MVSFKLIRKIKDEKFDEESLHRYTLVIHLSVRDLQVVVLDADSNRPLFFEDYIFNDLHSREDLIDVVRSLFEAHALLMAGFWKNVIFGIKNNQLVQVPSSLFQPEGAADYLRFNATTDPEKDIVLFCRHSLGDVVTVFAMPRNVHDWISGLYKNSSVTFVHQSAAMIEGVIDYSSRVQGNPLYIYVDRFKLHILSASGGKLIYYNQFVIQQFADYIRYIMLVMNGLKMDQATSQVVLWGYIGKNSPHYQEFYKYIQNVTFGGRPQHLKFGYMFDEVQEHHFFDLFAMNLLPK